MKSYERRLQNLEAAVTPPEPIFRVRTLLDLVNLVHMDPRPVVVECDAPIQALIDRVAEHQVG
jgi:hypothetical protein